MYVITAIKTHGSESQGQEEAECMCVFWPTRPLKWVIYTDGSSKIWKCCNSATIVCHLLKGNSKSVHQGFAHDPLRIGWNLVCG